MNYTSGKLCHFVGRTILSDEDKYKLLVKIIKDKKLIANMQNQDMPGISTSPDYIGENLGELYKRTDCICFCDIPDEALHIHTNKYGKFGFGFNKNYLASKGTHPVMYIPANHNIVEISSTHLPKIPQEYFSTLIKENTTINFLLLIANFVRPFTQILDEIKKSSSSRHLRLLDAKVIRKLENGKFHELYYAQLAAFTSMMGHIKLFDSSLSDDDENNYYMEREWRIVSNVEFQLNNIETIYLADEKYIKGFQDEFPEYTGEFYIL